MYKAEQEVRLIKFDKDHNITSANFTMGEKLTITNVVLWEKGLFDSLDIYRIYIKQTNYRAGNWYVPITSIQPWKNNPITEKDYLDCFQMNFKEGV